MARREDPCIRCLCYTCECLLPTRDLSQRLNDLLWEAGIFDDKVGDDIVKLFKEQEKQIIELKYGSNKDL